MINYYLCTLDFKIFHFTFKVTQDKKTPVTYLIDSRFFVKCFGVFSASVK